MYTATISGGSAASPINFRKKPSTSSALIDQIPQGAKVAVMDDGGDWCTVVYKGMTGYVMRQFVHPDAAQTTPETGSATTPGGAQTAPGQPKGQPGDAVTLILTRAQAESLMPILSLLNDQLGSQIGRG